MSGGLEYTEMLLATAPDGSTVMTPAHPDLRDDEMCVAECGDGPGLNPLCTEPRGHRTPWHIASTGESIIAVWAVES